MGVTWSAWAFNFNDFGNEINPKKNCTKGQPCGATCISWSYTCHVGTTTSTPTTPTNYPPVALINASPTSGNVPLSVNVNGSKTYDIDGSIVSYQWTSSDDQTKSGVDATFIFATPNVYTITLTVTDNKGATSNSSSTVSALTDPKPVIPTLSKPDPATCFIAKLESVIDGDTIYISNNGSQEKIRISQIDAPEKSQGFGVQAKECLKNILNQGELKVCRNGKDKYGRTLADLLVNNIDVAHSLVKQGCAWAYTQYLEDGSDLPAVQDQAKNSALGLWATQNAVAPWDYRHGTVPVAVLQNRNSCYSSDE